MGKFKDIRNRIAAFSDWVLVRGLSGTYKESYSKNAVEKSTIGDFLAEVIGFFVALFWIIPVAVYRILQKVVTKIMSIELS